MDSSSVGGKNGLARGTLVSKQAERRGGGGGGVGGPRGPGGGGGVGGGMIDSCFQLNKVRPRHRS